MGQTLAVVIFSTSRAKSNNGVFGKFSLMKDFIISTRLSGLLIWKENTSVKPLCVIALPTKQQPIKSTASIAKLV